MLTDLLDSGVAFVLFLQGLGDWLVPPMRFFTFLGTEDFYLLFMPILLWTLDFRLGLRVGVILLLSASVNASLKWAFHLPRPYWVEPLIAGLVSEPSFGAPSGHAQFSASIYGLIAASLRRPWAWVSAVLLIFFIGFSRLVLGVHFHFDVLLGWLFGLILLLLFLRYEGLFQRWLARLRFPAKISFALAVSLIIIFGAVLILGLSQQSGLPDAWVSNALADQPEEIIDPLNLESIITPAATLFGLALGALWLAERGGFDAQGAYWKRGLRYFIGVVGVSLLWLGLGAIFPDDPNLLSYSLRFVRYTLIGLWIAGLAPWLFIRLNLAHRGE